MTYRTITADEVARRLCYQVRDTVPIKWRRVHSVNDPAFDAWPQLGRELVRVLAKPNPEFHQRRYDGARVLTPLGQEIRRLQYAAECLEVGRLTDALTYLDGIEP